MFQIKGQVQPSYLSNFNPYRLISHLRDNGQPNTFYLPNLKPNRYKYHVSRHIERQIHPSYLSNFKPYMLKSHFRDKGHSNTFILPNTKPNRFTNHVLNQGTSSTFPFIKFATIQTKISFTRQGVIPILFYVPNLKPNRYKFHLSRQGTLRDKFILHIYQTSNHMG